VNCEIGSEVETEEGEIIRERERERERENGVVGEQEESQRGLKKRIHSG